MAWQAGKPNRKREMQAVWYSQHDDVWSKVLLQLPRFSLSWSVNVLPCMNPVKFILLLSEIKPG